MKRETEDWLLERVDQLIEQEVEGGIGQVVYGDQVQDILRYFEYSHLPERLQEISRPFHKLANNMAGGVVPSPQLVQGLWRLLEAKDCFVRAQL